MIFPWYLRLINQICYRSQMKGISSHRKYNPTKSKVVLSLYALLSCVMKVSGTILFFQATLGLNDCLRHLQGSQAAFLWRNKKTFQSCNIANIVSTIQSSFWLYSKACCDRSVVAHSRAFKLKSLLFLSIIMSIIKTKKFLVLYSNE